MNLRTLKYFVAIVDAGTLTAAAEALSIAQPALSRQMRDLEADLGVQLLHRTSQGVRMTSAGATLYESARRMLNEAQRVRKRLEGPQSGAETTIVLGASPTLARMLLSGVFQRCQTSLSGVRLSIREAFTPTLLEWLEKGVIDLGITTNTPESLSGRPLAMQPLVGEPFGLVTQVKKGVASVVPVAQVARMPLLMTTLHRRIVEHELLPLGVHLNIRSEIDSVDTIRELVLHGEWSTLMPVSVFRHPTADDRIVISEVSGVQLNRQLMMASRIERHEHSALSVVKDLVFSELSRLTQQGLFSFRAG